MTGEFKDEEVTTTNDEDIAKLEAEILNDKALLWGLCYGEDLFYIHLK